MGTKIVNDGSEFGDFLLAMHLLSHYIIFDSEDIWLIRDKSEAAYDAVLLCCSH